MNSIRDIIKGATMSADIPAAMTRHALTKGVVSKIAGLNYNGAFIKRVRSGEVVDHEAFEEFRHAFKRIVHLLISAETGDAYVRLRLQTSNFPELSPLLLNKRFMHTLHKGSGSTEGVAAQQDGNDVVQDFGPAIGAVAQHAIEIAKKHPALALSILYFRTYLQQYMNVCNYAIEPLMPTGEHNNRLRNLVLNTWGSQSTFAFPVYTGFASKIDPSVATSNEPQLTARDFAEFMTESHRDRFFEQGAKAANGEIQIFRCPVASVVTALIGKTNTLHAIYERVLENIDNEGVQHDMRMINYFSCPQRSAWALSPVGKIAVITKKF